MQSCTSCHKKSKNTIECFGCKNLICKKCIENMICISQKESDTKCSLPLCQITYDRKIIDGFYKEKVISTKIYQKYNIQYPKPRPQTLSKYIITETETKTESEIKQTRKMPNHPKEFIDVTMDGSCFYHCIVKALSSRDFTDETYQDICEILKPIVENYIQIHEDEDTEEETEEDEKANDAEIFRYSISEIATEEDYQNYCILQQAESENILISSLEEFKKTLAYTKEYANHVTIQLLFRLFQGLLGIYIYKNEVLVSPNEWLEKKYNVVLVLLENQHYNLIHFENYPLLLNLEEVQKVCHI